MILINLLHIGYNISRNPIGYEIDDNRVILPELDEHLASGFSVEQVDIMFLMN